MISKKELADILKDEDFMSNILDMQTAEEVQKAFKEEKETDISTEDIRLMGDIINLIVEKNTSNLSEKDLESISGGNKILVETEKEFVLPVINAKKEFDKVKWCTKK